MIHFLILLGVARGLFRAVTAEAKVGFLLGQGAGPCALTARIANLVARDGRHLFPNCGRCLEIKTDSVTVELDQTHVLHLFEIWGYFGLKRGSVYFNVVGVLVAEPVPKIFLKLLVDAICAFFKDLLNVVKTEDNKDISILLSVT
jgi:hypothetical protein